MRNGLWGASSVTACPADGARSNPFPGGCCYMPVVCTPSPGDAGPLVACHLAINRKCPCMGTQAGHRASTCMQPALAARRSWHRGSCRRLLRPRTCQPQKQLRLHVRVRPASQQQQRSRAQRQLRLLRQLLPRSRHSSQHRQHRMQARWSGPRRRTSVCWKVSRSTETTGGCAHPDPVLNGHRIECMHIARCGTSFGCCHVVVSQKRLL